MTSPIVDGKGLKLAANWAFASIRPGLLHSPSELHFKDLAWSAAQVPGTVASSQRELGLFNWGQQDLDGQDHWYRCDCQLPGASQVTLCFGGLATLARVFWNDELILTCRNMFLQHEVNVSHLPRRGVLAIQFQALATDLAVKRPRPRWRTRLVEQQQLRWIRTSLMGRIPGWSPTAAPVGPYREIRVRTSDEFVLVNSSINASLVGDTGAIALQVRIQVPAGKSLTKATLHVGSAESSMIFGRSDDQVCEISGNLQIPDVTLWWPHSHGLPNLYPVHLALHFEGDVFILQLKPVGFRRLQLDQSKGAFGVSINGQAIFCRGACWTPVDVVTLNASKDALRQTLTLVKDTGMNMVRIGGTMVYESDDFYRLCDELGILVWQDFMFANMDYPVNDDVFAASIAAEATQFLERVQASPCLVVLCGGSEIEQQAAMLGLPPEHWRNDFFGVTLPALCAEFCPQVPYVPSSPSGGAMPFQVDQSVSHYYGVGAYLRPLDDARRSGVRFTSECLGFSNVPEESTVESLLGNGQQPFHHPVWKQRVPRDSGAGWDFEDVRDHYLAELFKVDPMRLRYADMAKYLAMSRVLTGEVMARTMSEWRREASSCQGALVWFLRDLWPGAGWGVIDAHGVPKAAYFALKRVLAPLAVVISDEGLNGLVLHVFNDGPDAFNGQISLRLIRLGEVQVAEATQEVHLAPHASFVSRADAMFQHFVDTSYAYRFGPPGHHAAVATLLSNDGAAITSQAFHFPEGIDSATTLDLGLKAAFEQTSEGDWHVVLTTRQLAQYVHLDVPGCQPADNYFHLAPGTPRKVKLTGVFKGGSPKGTIGALNWQNTGKISVSALSND